MERDQVETKKLYLIEMNNRMQIVEHYVTGTTSSLLYLTSYYKVEVELKLKVMKICIDELQYDHSRK